jgi:hypothetical protein
MQFVGFVAANRVGIANGFPLNAFAWSAFEFFDGTIFDYFLQFCRISVAIFFVGIIRAIRMSVASPSDWNAFHSSASPFVCPAS